METLQKIWNLFLDVIFPPICVNCLRRGEKALCDECAARIEINNSFFCPECNRRLPARDSLPKNQNLCHPRVKFVLAAAASYQDRVVRELIHALKYNRAKTVLEPLGEIINKYLEKVIRNSKLEIRNFAVVPLPLHPQKERERGFNQAYLVAEVLRQCLEVRPPRGSTSQILTSIREEVEPRKIGIETNNLVRTKNTKSQTKMKDHEKRQENVSGAFSLKRPEAIVGQNVILVDDVFTSGATMKEAVLVLKNAGAKKIIGFVIAKT
ncbi:MAG: hypothetical protein UY26_C0002G0149 [Candidatus Jorgensenbacteria bacterium GW2011_GWA1_48_13]|uniref:Phosphoribosyltransferase n=1 Tax=Candidatus Jorgensenbacteria bacterium GW2011_GWB1_50_10 TaxID=1618665 RepID=A0A0G1YK27_9BACT|nr:MAG: hypothetical protein UY26_C0002G0149 [Candidatus Jorgensenbacteria bacterium GW2011_GWA1_48_13]KKW15362.1 MAG: hypothetical protein UY55_C0001G0116 [Candidatus Jorgensenbacteria bacterium GW2011_GWB1_50_10]